MELLVAAALLAPMILLVWALVRHARRIRQEAIDKDVRSQQLEQINAALVRYVLERDGHTCRTCGSTCQVGIDFTGDTPGEGKTIHPEDLEAKCARCFVARWGTLREAPTTPEERAGIIRRIW
jgi:hypothetical protein